MMKNDLIADRIKNQTGYRFTSLMEIKRKVKEECKREIIDLGIGEQSCGAPKNVIKVINKETKKRENHIYSDNGIEDFKEAVCSYYLDEYDLYFNPKTEINHCMGIKSSLCILPLCYVNPGDYILMSKPGYVVLENMAKWLGAKVEYLLLKEENNYLFSLKDIDEEILKKTKILYMNYPNNPTGQIANKEFYLEVISYAKKYGFIVVNDAAYLDLTFDKKDRISFMEVEGSKDVGVEVFSFSKGYNMTGFRIGYIIGNKDIIKAFRLVKDNMDSGQFIPIQKGAIQALKEKEFIDNNCQKIKRRHQKIINIFNSIGLKSSLPKATFYQLVKVPSFIKNKDEEIKINSATDFSMFLLKKLQIMTIPYEDSNFVRVSVTFNAKDEAKEDEIISELKDRLGVYEFIY